MKKVVFSLLAVSCLIFVGCSNDDDDDQNCAVCAIDFLGTPLTTEACDNGDGTVTITVEGQSEILTSEDLEGASPAEYVAALKEGCPN